MFLNLLNRPSTTFNYFSSKLYRARKKGAYFLNAIFFFPKIDGQNRRFFNLDLFFYRKQESYKKDKSFVIYV
jgi:hypothetical protein